MTKESATLRRPEPAARPLRAADSAHASRTGAGRWRVVATKEIDASDPYSRGHFPDFSVFPGVFVIECLRQAVAECVAPDLRVTAVGSARFRTPLLPGDVLHVDADVGEISGGGLSVTALAVNQDGERVATLQMTLGPRDA